MYLILGQTNDLRFVGGENDAPFYTPMCDCCVEGLLKLRATFSSKTTVIAEKVEKGSYEVIG